MSSYVWRGGGDGKLEAALDFLASTAGVALDPAALRAAVDRARTAQQNWTERLRAAGRGVLAVRSFRRALGQVTAEDPLPAITGTSQGWLAVLERRGARLRVVTDADPRPRWERADEVQKTLEIEIPEWLHAVPAAPLEPMRDGTPWKRLRALVSIERQDLWVIVIYGVTVGFLSLVIPIGVQTLVTTLAFGTLMQPIVVLMLLLAGVLGFAGLLRAMQYSVVELLRQRAFARAAVDVAHRMPRVATAQMDFSPPELVNRFLDVVLVQKTATSLLLDGLAVVLQTAIGMIVLAFYHPFLLAFDVMLIVCLICILLLGRGATEATIKMSKAKYEVVAWLEDIARHTVAFKSPGGMAHATDRATQLARVYLAKARKRFGIVYRQLVAAYALQVVAFCALLGMGGWLVIQRQLTIGQLIAAELIVMGLVEGFTKLGKHFESFYDLLGAMDKLGQLVDVPCERADGSLEDGPDTAAGLRVRELTASPAIAGLSLEVEAGRHVGIVGGEGSGKSTLARALWGLAEPSAGVIEIDGVDIRALALEQLRKQIAVVQGVEIWCASVLENVTCGRPLGVQEIEHALTAVGLKEAIARLPEGLDTPIGGASTLSSSEERRLMIARAIASRPRVLVLDGLLDEFAPESGAQLLETLTRGPFTLLLLTKHERLARALPVTYRLENGALR